MLQKSEKEQAPAAGMTAIEAEGKFVEVGVQMGRGDRSLMGTEQPAFEQRSNAMYSRHGDMCRIPGAGKVDGVVPVSMFGKVVVTSPPVGAYLRAWLDCATDKRNEAGA